MRTLPRSLQPRDEACGNAEMLVCWLSVYVWMGELVSLSVSWRMGVCVSRVACVNGVNGQLNRYFQVLHFERAVDPAGDDVRQPGL